MDKRLLTFYWAHQGQWDGLIKGMNPTDVQTLYNEARAMAEWLTLFSIYLGYRGAYGTGDHGHEAAIKDMSRG